MPFGEFQDMWVYRDIFILCDVIHSPEDSLVQLVSLPMPPHIVNPFNVWYLLPLLAVSGSRSIKILQAVPSSLTSSKEVSAPSPPVTRIPVDSRH